MPYRMSPLWWSFIHSCQSPSVCCYWLDGYCSNPEHTHTKESFPQKDKYGFLAAAVAAAGFVLFGGKLCQNNILSRITEGSGRSAPGYVAAVGTIFRAAGV